jgi:hypothetical protein
VLKAAVRGRVAPLVAAGEITTGRLAGVRFVIKGGSGGDADTLQRVLAAAVPRRRAAV